MYVLLSDPSGTGAASVSLMTTLTHWIVNYAVPMLVGIMASGFSVMLLIKFAKRSMMSGDGGYDSGYSQMSDAEKAHYDYEMSFFEDF